jgi:hypothetical protein
LTAIEGGAFLGTTSFTKWISTSFFNLLSPHLLQVISHLPKSP